jgi:hypothetical protein
VDKDFARGEHMMRRPDLQQGQRSETDQLQQSSQRGRFQPSWAKQGSALDTSDDDVLPPIPEHLKTNAWMKRYSQKNVQLDQSPSLENNHSAQTIAAVPQQQKSAQGSRPQRVAQMPTQPKGQWQTDYTVHPGSKDGTIKLIYAEPNFGEGQQNVKNKVWPANFEDTETFKKGARPSTQPMGFDGRIMRRDKQGKEIIIPFKKGSPLQLQPGDQIQQFVKDQPGKSKLTQKQRDEAIKKMPYGDKLVDAAKMVPDLLKGDAKAAFKALTTDPAFVAQLVGVSAVFAIAQATPAGPFIDAALIAVLGFSGGFSLANYLLKANDAKDEKGLKASAEELKNLVEIVGLAALSGALRTASKVLGRIKGSVTAEQASRKILFDEMTQAGIKHTPENILKIARGQNGKILFLEKGTIEAGKKPSGLAHILDKHESQFLDIGISKEKIPEIVMAAATQGKKIGTQGATRGIYEIVLNGKKKYISVEIGSNGYIVSANPAKTKTVDELLKSNKK